MGKVLIAGSMLFAFSVPAAIFLFVLARKAQLVIVSLTGFAIIWEILSPLKDTYWFTVFLGVIIMEITRFIFFRYYEKAERSFSVVSTNAIAYPLTDFYSSLAAGVGFGGVETVLLYGTVLSYSGGPGTLWSENCDYFSTFVLSAWNAFLFNILHITLMITAFDAFRRKHVWKLLFFLACHFLAAGATLLNRMTDGCLMSLPLIIVAVLASGIHCLLVVNDPTYRSNKRNS